jgi:hypothetical protein
MYHYSLKRDGRDSLFDIGWGGPGHVVCPSGKPEDSGSSDAKGSINRMASKCLTGPSEINRPVAQIPIDNEHLRRASA